MANSQTINIAILGAGKGGCALFDLLSNLPDVTIVGITDKNPKAPGLRRAAELRITATKTLAELIGHPEVDLIVDVTGDPSVPALIQRNKHPGSEVLGGAAARLLWRLVQHETQIQAQLLSAEKLASIGTFASGLAHDINNPLYLILGLAENLADEKDPAIIREQIRDIIQAVQRISALTRELMHYARYSGGDVAQDVELTSKLDEALKIARYATALQDLSVVKSYTAKPIVRANPDDLIHVFVNILTNAIHAMDGRGTLTLATEWFDHTARVAISDTGCGIAKENIGRIFDPFFTTKPPGKGTGLGLHNVRTIVKKLNGQISVDSEVGRGTTFRLDFEKV